MLWPGSLGPILKTYQKNSGNPKFYEGISGGCEGRAKIGAVLPTYAISIRCGQGLLVKLKHPPVRGGRHGFGTYGCSKHTSMVCFRGPPLDI